MKREDLKALGLTDEMVDKVMEMNGADINAQKATIASRDQTITQLTQERDGLKGQVADRDKDIANLKKTSGDNESLTKQLSDTYLFRGIREKPDAPFLRADGFLN